MSTSLPSANRIARPFEHLIFAGRWVIAPMYVGLLAVLGAYVGHSILDIVELFRHLRGITETNLMLATLGAVDGAMVANLVCFVMIGSYSIFVRKLSFPEAPSWLQTITSGTLKVKMSTSLIGITSIHLLRDFVGADKESVEMLCKHVGLHLVFLVSAIALTWVDKVSHTPSPSPSTH